MTAWELRVPDEMLRWILAIQGVYYGVSGLWPLIHMPSFLAVTGPKQDLWLVRTVGVLILVIGSVLLTAVARRRPSGEVVVLAIGTALALATIDVVYVVLDVIGPIYLADALVECALALGVGVSARPGRLAPHA